MLAFAHYTIKVAASIRGNGFFAWILQVYASDRIGARCDPGWHRVGWGGGWRQPLFIFWIIILYQSKRRNHEYGGFVQLTATKSSIVILWRTETTRLGSVWSLQRRFGHNARTNMRRNV